MWSSNGASTPAAVAERFPNKGPGSMIHRYPVSAVDGVRASPMIGMDTPKQKINGGVVSVESIEVGNEANAGINEIKEEKEIIKVVTKESPVKQVENEIPLPGAVHQEVA